MPSQISCVCFSFWSAWCWKISDQSRVWLPLWAVWYLLVVDFAFFCLPWTASGINTIIVHTATKRYKFPLSRISIFPEFFVQIEEVFFFFVCFVGCWFWEVWFLYCDGPSFLDRRKLCIACMISFFFFLTLSPCCVFHSIFLRLLCKSIFMCHIYIWSLEKVKWWLDNAV